MTDFVAVIRRAVDGLRDNNPEMRERVYEKARSAVLKQLENMKPKLSDEVIARQIAKLDEAVRIVEREHAEALPDTDNAPPVQANLAAEDPQPVETADPYGGPASRVEYDSRSEQIADLAPSTDADAYQVAVERFGDNPSQRPDRLPEDRLLDNPEAF
ncbi:MAG: hypothetical protein RIR97_1724, partial [Pseudomonadota bacterium]